MSNYSDFFLNMGGNIVQLELIEISHSKFSQTYRLVRNAINGVTVTLEDASSHTFDYYPMQIVPSGAYDNLDETMQVNLGDLGALIPMELDRLVTSTGSIPGTVERPKLKYRTYRSDDLTAPLFGPIVFDVQNISFKKEGATLQCAIARLNLTATGEVYTMDRFPMLRGFI